jgi:hypothetical protein
MQGAVVCRFIGAFKDAHKWASYRYVSSAVTKATQEMGIFQREISRELVNWKIGELVLTNL